jgi:16S rRNA (uracil1498-N3)-methyltransferase
MVRRFVVSEGLLERSGAVVLSGDVASHLRDVLRSRVGDRVLLSDGTGREADASVTAFSKQNVTVMLEEPRALEEPAGTHLTLLQCVAKGDKVDQIVRQTVELGVRAIVPVLSERSVAEKRSRTERWRAIAEDSIRVSGRAHRARIEEVVSFAELLARPRSALSLCFALGAEEGLAEYLAKIVPPKSAEILVGPEGGLSAGEVSRAVSAGFTRVHLGAHTLRTETAGPAIAAMILYWSGAIAR